MEFPIGTELPARLGTVPEADVVTDPTAVRDCLAAAEHDPVNPVLAEVVRSGIVESRHRGSLAVLAADGSLLMAIGAVGLPMFPRSSNKPMQAAAMLRCGLRLEGELLALAASSHSGEEFHVRGVREILRTAGLSESDLQCPPDLPLDDTARHAWLREGGVADRVHMNCSGKHAAMLATCVAAGWPPENYRDPDHPLEVRIKRVIAGLAGEVVAATGVDGCGAPLFSISVVGLARAFRELVLAETGSAERAVADAMRANPVWTSGTTRAEAAMAGAVPGLLIKSGAEGVCAFALADGRAAAVKFDDGAQRAVPPLMAELLTQLIGPGERDAAEARTRTEARTGAGAPARAGALAGLVALAELARPPVSGGGVPVGEVRAVLPQPAW